MWNFPLSELWGVSSRANAWFGVIQEELLAAEEAARLEEEAAIREAEALAAEREEAAKNY